MFNLKHIGLRVKQRRQFLSMTQQQLANAAQISTSYLSKIEAGEQNLTLDTVERLAISLDEDAFYLLVGLRMDHDMRLYSLLRNSSAEFIYLVEQAILELERQGILTIKHK